MKYVVRWTSPSNGETLTRSFSDIRLAQAFCRDLQKRFVRSDARITDLDNRVWHNGAWGEA